MITGSELVRGDRQDLNGPYLARSLLALRLEPSELRIVAVTSTTELQIPPLATRVSSSADFRGS